MSTSARFQLHSARFELREAEASDLDDIHAVFASRPEFLALREDIAAASPGYDRNAVKTYCDMAMLDPDRHLLVIVDRVTSARVGLVDFVIQSPADGLPWIGLVMTHRAHGRQGVASEAVEALAEYLASQGRRAVRMAVMEASATGLEFAHNVGFEDFGTATASPGNREVVLMELALPWSGGSKPSPAGPVGGS